MAEMIDVREILGCNCLKVRRLARRLTQLYEEAMTGAGITVTQFGLMGHIYGVGLANPNGISAVALAERTGTDPTTLSRVLRTMRGEGLVIERRDPADGRVRHLRLTAAGEAKLREAMQLWRKAQTRANEILGADVANALRAVVDQSIARLAG